MKTTIKTSLILLVVVAAFSVTSCKSKKKEQTATVDPGYHTIVEPCSQYKSDSKTFRATAMGESMDQQTAKNKALIEAKRILAASISTTIKSTLDNYVKDNEHNTKEDLEKKYEGLTREVIDQKLSGIKEVCSELQANKDQTNYKAYVAIELGADDLVQAINDKLTKDESLKVDYDYEKFKKTFEEEMAKQK